MLLLPAYLQAETTLDDIVVLGLFEHAVMLSIDGKHQLLKKGERNEAGVTLIVMKPPSNLAVGRRP